jgi:hypothetical protein
MLAYIHCAIIRAAHFMYISSAMLYSTNKQSCMHTHYSVYTTTLSEKSKLLKHTLLHRLATISNDHDASYCSTNCSSLSTAEYSSYSLLAGGAGAGAATPASIGIARPRPPVTTGAACIVFVKHKHS